MTQSRLNNSKDQMCLCCVQPGNTPFLRKDIRMHSSLLRTFATLPSLAKLPFDFSKVKFKGSKRCIQKQRRRFLYFISRLCFSVRQTKCNTCVLHKGWLTFVCHSIKWVWLMHTAALPPRLACAPPVLQTRSFLQRLVSGCASGPSPNVSPSSLTSTYFHQIAVIVYPTIC